MSKKKNHQQEPQQAAPPPSQPAQSPEDTVSNTRIWIFWIGVALTVIVARALDAALPGVSEAIIERWVMLGFAAFLAVFLLTLK